MKKLFTLAISAILLTISSCTNNNQNQNPSFEYLAPNDVITINGGAGGLKQYDINNDGVIELNFQYAIGNLWTNCASGTSYVLLLKDSTSFLNGYICKPISSGTSINDQNIWVSPSSCIFMLIDSGNIVTPFHNLSGIGDFYIGFKSQNLQATNTNFGWAKLNISANEQTLTVKEIAFNKVNGGSINAGQH
jgi:hypothetical protein